jgi:hypothetical protein
MTLIIAMDHTTTRKLDVNPENLASRSFEHFLSVDFLEPVPEMQKRIDLTRPWISWGNERPFRLTRPIPFLRHELRRDQDLTACSIQRGELDVTFGRAAGVDSSPNVGHRRDAFGLPLSLVDLFAIDSTSACDPWPQPIWV